jgi:diaminohydroxyphosphoribosylaminopyrimidine deaminase/5-amino-6-(5-phosphoribosylamino)uracil reductase
VQELAVVMAPKLLGGKPARTPLGDLKIEDLDQAPAFQPLGVESLGRDWLHQGLIQPMEGP